MLPSELATQVVNDRRSTYGHPADVYSRVAPMWSQILNIQVTAEKVALCMIALKLGREAQKHNEDNLTDIAGYANVVKMIRDWSIQDDTEPDRP